MRAILRKDTSVWLLLGELAHRIDSQSYQVVDNWEADLYAVGVAALNNPDHLVYVCTFEQPQGTVVYECETSSTDTPYIATSGTAGSVDELASIIQQHLKQASTSR